MTLPLAGLGDFGPIVGDGTTSNDIAFMAALASNRSRICIPDGVYYTTLTFAQLAGKFWFGPGKIKTAYGDWAPARFSHIAATPRPGGAALPGSWRGDLSLVDPEYYILDPNVRVGLSESYFEPTTTPHWIYMDTSAGHSGTTCRVKDACPAGSSVISTTGCAELAAGGQTFALLNPDGSFRETFVSKTHDSNYIATMAPLTLAHPAGTQITLGARTNISIHHAEMVARGGGDNYIAHYRIYSAPAPLSGQTDTFEVQTAGIDGGDVTASASGGYLQSREVNFLDQGFDVACIAEVRSFQRSNNTGARKATWIGQYFKSEGSKPCDIWSLVTGLWNQGLDFTRANFGAGQRAVSLSAGQRVYLSASCYLDSDGTHIYANTPGGRSQIGL